MLELLKCGRHMHVIKSSVIYIYFMLVWGRKINSPLGHCILSLANSTANHIGIHSSCSKNLDTIALQSS